MKNFTIDRPIISTEEIEKKEDFNSIMEHLEIEEKDVYAKPNWFKGAITGVAVMVMVSGSSIHLKMVKKDPEDGKDKKGYVS